MLPYILFGMYLLYLIFRYDICLKKNNKSRHIYICLLYLFLLVGLRYQFGPDSYSYEKEFSSLYNPIGTGTLYYPQLGRLYPPLWIGLNVFCRTVGDFVLLQLICSFVFNICIFYFIKNTTTKVFTALFIFFIYDYLYFSTDILRESLAIGIDLVALIMFFKNKKILSIILLFIGFSIHIYSIFFIVTMSFLYFGISKKVVAIGGLFFAFFVNSQINATDFIANYLFLGDPTGYGDGFENISLLGFAFKSSVALILIYFLYLNKINNNDSPFLLITKSNNDLKKILYAYFATVLMRYSIPIADRVFNYFEIIYLVVIVEGLYRFVICRGTYHQKVLKLTILIFITYLPFYMINSGTSDKGVSMYVRYYPYNSIFQKEYIEDRIKFYIEDGR